MLALSFNTSEIWETEMNTAWTLKNQLSSVKIWTNLQSCPASTSAAWSLLPAPTDCAPSVAPSPPAATPPAGSAPCASDPDTGIARTGKKGMVQHTNKLHIIENICCLCNVLLCNLFYGWPCHFCNRLTQLSCILDLTASWTTAVFVSFYLVSNCILYNWSVCFVFSYI